MADETIRKFRVKFGEAEFEADVPTDKVQSMYDQFLATLEKRAERASWPFNAGQQKPKPPAEGATPDRLPGSFDDALLTRIFELRQDGYVTLRVLPKGDQKEADAFLLILYGYRRLKNEDTVLSTHLLRAGEFSGLNSYRPAHALATHESLIIRGGYKKGSTYTLNNQGIAKAEEIAARIFD
jgi:hypothetical protein